MLAYLLLGRQNIRHNESAFAAWLKRGYRRALDFALDHGRAVLAITVLLIAVAAFASVRLPRSFLPQFNEGTFTVFMTLNPGVSLAQSNRIGTIAERIIMDVPEVTHVGRRTGRAELDEHAEGVHASELEIDLKTSGRPKADVLADIRARLSVLPVDVNIGQPISHRLDHMLSGVRSELALKIFGDDLDLMRMKAEEFRARLAAIPGLADVQVEKQVRIPQLEIRIDYNRAALYGVQPGTVVDQLGRLSSGRVVSRVVDGHRRHDVVIRLPDSHRTVQGLSGLLIETPSGWIPASLVAEVRETDGPNQILRENGRRRIIVMANSDGRADMAKIVEAARGIVAETSMPEGMFASLEGTFKAQEEATRTIGILSVISLMLVFALLYSRYRSAVLAIIIIGSVPLALIGSVAALWIAGQQLSVASMIGFITLTGIAARNGILKISHIANLAAA